MAYADVSELENAVGALKLSLIVPAGSDDSIFDMALEAAAGEIDGSLAYVYETPISTAGLSSVHKTRVSALLKRLNISLAMPHIVQPGSKGLPEAVKDMVAWANAYLDKLKKHEARIDGLTTKAGAHFAMVDGDTEGTPYISDEQHKLWRYIT